MIQNPRIVIIGGDAAGLSAGAQIHRRNPTAYISIIEKKDYISYSKCSIPYILSGAFKDRSGLIHMTADEFEKNKGGKVLTEARVISVDLGSKIVTFEKAGIRHSLKWDKLIIATGASYGVPSSSSAPIYTPGIEEYFSARAEIQSGKLRKALVVGGGFSGIETAYELKKAGVGVTLIEGAEILPGFSSMVKNAVKAVFEEKIIPLHEKVLYHGMEKSNAKTSKGPVNADAVFLCTGIKPATDLFDLQKDARGAIIVDGRMRTSAADVFAAGDCVSYRLSGGSVNIFVPLGTYANKAGVIAGDSALGLPGLPLQLNHSQVISLGRFQAGRTGLSHLEKGLVSHQLSSLESPLGERKDVINLILRSTKDGIIAGCEFWGYGDALRRLYLIASMIGRPLDDLIGLDLPYTPVLSKVKDITITAAMILKAKIDQYNS